MTSDVAGIPHSARPLWQELMSEELVPVHELFNEVMKYQKLIEARKAAAHDFDREPDSVVVRDLSRVSLELLRTIGPTTPEPRRRVIQAAVRYFLREDDGDADLDSVLGFDDDAEVMNAVLAHLGHGEWIIEVP